MIAFLRELMTKIGFRAAYFLGCEHLEDGGHTPKIVVLVSTEEADFDLFALMDDYLTEEDTLQSTGISKTYSIGRSSDGKYFYIYND